jgi:hypothetical protein
MSEYLHSHYRGVDMHPTVIFPYTTFELIYEKYRKETSSSKWPELNSQLSVSNTSRKFSAQSNSAHIFLMSQL